MSFIEVLLIAVALAMDACAVSLAAGASGRIPSFRAEVRLAFHLGLFQFLMPIVGWLAGSQLVSIIAAFDHWVAFGLLALVAIHMLRGGAESDTGSRQNCTRGWTLVALSVATSLDALAVGLSLACLRISIWVPTSVIGLVTVSLSLGAAHLGRRLGIRFGRPMEVFGGLVLLAIGIRILVIHLQM